MFGGAVGSAEEVFLAPESNGTDGALDGIGVDFDAAIIEEAGEPIPAREYISDCFAIVDFPETVASFASS